MYPIKSEIRMKGSINQAWLCEDDDYSDSSLPFNVQLCDEFLDSYEDLKRSLLNGFEEVEMQPFMQLSEEVENNLSRVSEFVTYTSIWHGRVLEEMGDTILAHIVKTQDEEQEFFVKIAKNKLESSQRAMMIPGALFDWSFGYKGSINAHQIWKIEFHQVPRPTPEAIKNMVKKMTMGFEHFYQDQD